MVVVLNVLVESTSTSLVVFFGFCIACDCVTFLITKCDAKWPRATVIVLETARWSGFGTPFGLPQSWTCYL